MHINGNGSREFLQSDYYRENFEKEMKCIEIVYNLCTEKFFSKTWRLCLADGEMVLFRFTPYNFPHAVGINGKDLKGRPYFKKVAADKFCDVLISKKDEIYKDIVNGDLDQASVFSPDYDPKLKALFYTDEITLDNIMFVCRYDILKAKQLSNNAVKLDCEYIIGIRCLEGFTIWGISKRDETGFGYVKTNLGYPATDIYLKGQEFIPVLGMTIHDDKTTLEATRCSYTYGEVKKRHEALKKIVVKYGGYINAFHTYNILFNQAIDDANTIEMLEENINNLLDQLLDSELLLESALKEKEETKLSLITAQKEKEDLERIKEELLQRIGRLQKTQSPIKRFFLNWRETHHKENI